MIERLEVKTLKWFKEFAIDNENTLVYSDNVSDDVLGYIKLDEIEWDITFRFIPISFNGEYINV